ncbi:serine hydrolase domain-containing protein [Microbacterium sp. 5K110]|jgi:CubicO group peptidase (beta-lactamase class C family)|uniref:serine hydrolase domain-containing protein n=1 Tax=unclassified Microbacterium TaxID=2609290 RepID=UPI001BB260EB|nr:serine hydrolase domain-containing protein [Microbacterium sp. 5K110]
MSSTTATPTAAAAEIGRAEKSGMSTPQLARLRSTIEQDIEAGEYHGATVIVARHGDVVLEAAIGSTDASTQRSAALDDVFRVLSVTKALTNTAVYRAIDAGLLTLNTRVVDVIPEYIGSDRFLARGKETVTVAHLLSHRSGMNGTPEPLPYAQLGDLSAVIEKICEMPLAGEPGTTVDYSPTLNHALLGEMVRRVHGDTSFSQMMAREVLDPIGMVDTAFGLPERLAERVVPIRAMFGNEGWLTAHDLEVLNDVISGDAEMPWVGSVTTARDIFRLAEVYRRRGKTESGEQLVSPAIIDVATRVQTGDDPNNLYLGMAKKRGWPWAPANLGYGFQLSGLGAAPSMLGTLTSARTFGNHGAGSTVFWVDPERDVTFVLLTAGSMEESDNYLRCQRLSDLAICAAL